MSSGRIDLGRQIADSVFIIIFLIGLVGERLLQRLLHLLLFLASGAEEIGGQHAGDRRLLDMRGGNDVVAVVQVRLEVLQVRVLVFPGIADSEENRAVHNRPQLVDGVRSHVFVDRRLVQWQLELASVELEVQVEEVDEGPAERGVLLDVVHAGGHLDLDDQIGELARLDFADVVVLVDDALVLLRVLVLHGPGIDHLRLDDRFIAVHDCVYQLAKLPVLRNAKNIIPMNNKSMI